MTSTRRRNLASTTSLDPERIVHTIAKLEQRIEERFPDSGLGRLCKSLFDIGNKTRERLDRIESPVVWLRALTWLLAAAIVIGAVAAVRTVVLEMPSGFEDAFVALQFFESGIQDLVFVGIAFVFLISVEGRLRRRRAPGVHPRAARRRPHRRHAPADQRPRFKVLAGPGDTQRTRHRSARSPNGRAGALPRLLQRDAFADQSKIAALYIREFRRTPVAPRRPWTKSRASSTGLSRKIWQKIMILDAAK